MPFEFGDVVLVTFPFTHQAASKKRPAVVISGSSYNSMRPDVVIMAITSQLHATTEVGEAWIAQWREAGLLKPSAVKPVIATIEQKMAERQLGRLEPQDQRGLRAAIAAILA